MYGIAMLQAFGVTDRGRIRPTNEDCFGIDPNLQLCVVADGMGGHNAGEVASRMAVETVLDYVSNRAVTTTWPYGYDQSCSPQGNLLRTAVQVANARVFETAASSPQCSGMGTTIVAALVAGGTLTIAHVGDSRFYTVEDHQARQLTEDDSWVAAMLARDPHLDPGLLKTHPMRNALTSVIGSRPTVTVHISERPLSETATFVLTTDGVHGVLSPDELAAQCGGADLQAMAERLVRSAIEHGSRDNCTAVVARVSAAQPA
jgi:protein phosphatase